METGVLSLVVSSLGTIVAIVGIGWFGLDRMEQRIKADAQKAHDLIGENIGGVRSDIDTLRSDVDTLRSEVSGMRSEITGLSGRVGHIEGMLEVMRDAAKSTKR